MCHRDWSACRGRWDKTPSEGGPAPLKFTVHRGSLLQDGWAALRSAGAAVKGRLVVTFVNEQGMLEAGLDYGGLVKEFLEQVRTFCQQDSLPVMICSIFVDNRLRI